MDRLTRLRLLKIQITKNPGFSGIYSVKVRFKNFDENVTVADRFIASNILFRIGPPNCFENVRNDSDLNKKIISFK